MTLADLERIEKELELSLPRSYREFMLSGKFGEGDEGAMEINGVADEVINANEEARKIGFYGAKWPENFFVIGDDGAGDNYFMDVQGDDPAIHFADHELTSNQGRLVIVQKWGHRTIGEFWEFIQKMNEATEKSLRRRWWQFLIRPF